MTTVLITLVASIIAMVAGVLLTMRYFRAAISVYNSVMRGDYTMLLVDADNPRLMDAGAVLMQGKIEAELAKLDEAESKPKLEVIKGGDDV